MAITYGDRLIDGGYFDITPEQERELEAREECARLGIDPDEVCADGGVLAWMVVDQKMRCRLAAAPTPQTEGVCTMPECQTSAGCQCNKRPAARIIEGAKEALAVARGEQPAASVWINGHEYVPASDLTRLRDELASARAERDLLQDVLDSRPAINAGLPETYVRWSQAIYSGDVVRAAIRRRAQEGRG